MSPGGIRELASSVTERETQPLRYPLNHSPGEHCAGGPGDPVNLSLVVIDEYSRWSCLELVQVLRAGEIAPFQGKTPERWYCLLHKGNHRPGQIRDGIARTEPIVPVKPVLDFDIKLVGHAEQGPIYYAGRPLHAAPLEAIGEKMREEIRTIGMPHLVDV